MGRMVWTLTTAGAPAVLKRYYSGLLCFNNEFVKVFKLWYQIQEPIDYAVEDDMMGMNMMGMKQK